MGKKATKVQQGTSGWLITLSDKTQVSAKILVIAAGPNDALSLFHEGEKPEVLSKAVKEARPVHLACLDVALSSLPQKEALFALGIDAPLYFSVHSPYAELAQPNGALIHVAKYLGSSVKPNPKEDEKKLEELLDLMQPGWRQVLVKKRPLPSMVLTNSLATAANGGIAGRIGPRIEKHLYVVGDWVGPEGLLSSTSFASAKRAAQLIQDEFPVNEKNESQQPTIAESMSS